MTMGTLLGDVAMRPPFRSWYRPKEARYLLEHEWLGPVFCEARATKGRAWWPLDSVILGTAANTPRGPGSSSAWHIIQASHVGEIDACFRELGFAGRLEVAWMPSREELER